ncbi:hypothetical protein HK102_005902 [Quaeritorhiza haematococci]|nr:hypothetical protein HK102_005902 [Quaeritorhiza haematococci]
MGIYISKLLDSLSNVFSNHKSCRILLLGLDGAGKTTLLYKMKLGENVTTIPTIGFNVETVQYKNINFTIWDVGGQERIRALWRHYYNEANGLIFMFDSNDICPGRITEAREELDNLMNREPELAGIPVLVLANKQDLPQALPVDQVAKALGLGLGGMGKGSSRWFIQATTATTGDGLYEGLDWLAKELGKPAR